MADDDKIVSNVTTDISVAIAILLAVVGLLGAYFAIAFDWYQQFLEWLYSKKWPLIFKVITAMFIAFDAALVWFLIFILRRHERLEREMPEEKPPAIHVVSVEDETKHTWEEIQQLANSPNPSDWNMAIIRADGLLDTILGRLGYEGETVADKLKIADPTKLLSLERIWSAHRLRNTIVHGPLVEHTRETVVHALRSYELAFKELGLLQEEEQIQNKDDRLS